MAHKRGVLHGHCEDLGRDPGEITVSTQALLFLSEDEDWLARNRADLGLPTIVGTPDEVTEIVAAYRDAGVDELILPDWTMDSLERRKDTYDLFMAEVALHFA
jgi:alkanesulfonate monooxygenase SsuD/methylene tetrahydromethanopterin reductase-like flavin-dependent oxidoreductase (luciferase family)